MGAGKYLSAPLLPAFCYTIYLMLTKLYPPVSLIPKSIFIQSSILVEHFIVNFHLLWFQNYI